jgi:hypothetical protein
VDVSGDYCYWLLKGRRKWALRGKVVWRLPGRLLCFTFPSLVRAVGCDQRVIGGLLVLVHIDGWVVGGLRACKEIERWDGNMNVTGSHVQKPPPLSQIISQPVQPAA